jgi:hypothetical protein
MPETTVFLLDIIDSNGLHGPERELHQDNGISNQINRLWVGQGPNNESEEFVARGIDNRSKREKKSDGAQEVEAQARKRMGRRDK